jgi:hypothetical protein
MLLTFSPSLQSAQTNIHHPFDNRSCQRCLSVGIPFAISLNGFFPFKRAICAKRQGYSDVLGFFARDAEWRIKFPVTKHPPVVRGED